MNFQSTRSFGMPSRSRSLVNVNLLAWFGSCSEWNSRLTKLERGSNTTEGSYRRANVLFAIQPALKRPRRNGEETTL